MIQTAITCKTCRDVGQSRCPQHVNDVSFTFEYRWVDELGYGQNEEFDTIKEIRESIKASLSQGYEVKFASVYRNYCEDGHRNTEFVKPFIF